MSCVLWGEVLAPVRLWGGSVFFTSYSKKEGEADSLPLLLSHILFITADYLQALLALQSESSQSIKLSPSLS